MPAGRRAGGYTGPMAPTRAGLERRGRFCSSAPRNEQNRPFVPSHPPILTLKETMTMDIETEILYAEDTQIEEEILREAWPIPPEDGTRSCED